MGALLVSIGGVMFTWFFVILISFCWHLHLSKQTLHPDFAGFVSARKDLHQPAQLRILGQLVASVSRWSLPLGSLVRWGHSPCSWWGGVCHWLRWPSGWTLCSSSAAMCTTWLGKTFGCFPCLDGAFSGLCSHLWWGGVAGYIPHRAVPVVKFCNGTGFGAMLCNPSCSSSAWAWTLHLGRAEGWTSWSDGTSVCALQLGQQNMPQSWPGLQAGLHNSVGHWPCSTVGRGCWLGSLVRWCL